MGDVEKHFDKKDLEKILKMANNLKLFKKMYEKYSYLSHFKEKDNQE